MHRWDDGQLRDVAASRGTPCFVYSRDMLVDRAKKLLSLEMPFGFMLRYAMKANNNPDVIQILHQAGLHFDASSSYEAQELLDLEIRGEKISLSSQQPAHDLPQLVSEGVRYVATSLHQLELFLALESRPNQVGLRVNPGVGAARLYWHTEIRVHKNPV